MIKLTNILQEIQIRPSIPKFMELNTDGITWNHHKFWVNIDNFLKTKGTSSKDLCKNCVQWKFDHLIRNKVNDINEFNREYYQYLIQKLKNKKI